MNHWLETSKRNLIPLSVADNFEDAQKEWVFTGEVNSGEEPEFICELCEHPELASQFQIKNNFNANTLLVGSKCINRFTGIQVIDELGMLATGESERLKVLQHALRLKLTENALTPLRKLYTRDPSNRQRIEWSGKRLKREEGVSPVEIAFLFERMDALGIRYNPVQYKVSLRSELDRNLLETMPSDRLRKIWLALSVPQRNRFKHLLSKI